MNREFSGWYEIDNDRFLLGLAIITAVAVVLRSYGIGAAPMTSDDVGAVASAFDFVRDGRYGPTMWQHPKLRDILNFIFLNLLGGGAGGVKGASIVLGTLSVPLIGTVTSRLSGSHIMGLLAALFLAVDSVHIDFSRQAIQEVHLPFFVLSALLVMLIYRSNRKSHLLVISGILFGLALAVKWSALFPLAATAAFLLFECAKDDLPFHDKCSDIAFIVVSLVVLPAAVYFLTYVPWFVRGGHDLWDWLAAQRLMARENVIHQGFQAYTNELTSYPVLWFLKPVNWADFTFFAGHPVVFVAISNPLVWMLTLPAFALLLYNGIKEKAPNLLFLSLLFWGAYLPLALARRHIWLNSSFAVTPFAFMGVAYFIITWLKRIPYRNLLCSLYLAAMLLTAVPLYFLAIGKGYGNPILHPVVELFRPANER
ncbi:phospholipid carrier-dependent glycosyltransferase [Geobacter sp. SVR]|uniref:phospholipid carrier-dependent glycosyltransferase n=1 Tax=Geobacter sp. SVR TaxID=2495594 RepID=UPI00143EF853|nr:phospholipid carrier-dependent glycosyltransferase [Geobacter sp. SVR]BCS52117.1 putative dolichyl-phosphate-mannose--protein mannosyltransferase [Geobacter sp. SVR]GCF86572.1 hypothetical protein GSbR_31720 [Geobacter sp. SVR]